MVGAGSQLDGRALVAADFDRDGDIDLFLVNNNQPCIYLENRHGNQRNWAVVQLRGSRSNSHGVGARIRLRTGERTQTREIHIGSGYLASPPPEAHFGLDASKTIDRIEVRWPTGEVQVIDNLEVNRIIAIDEGGGFRYVNPGTFEAAPTPAAARDQDPAPERAVESK